MKFRSLGPVALAILALSAFTGSASATTLEVNGIAKNETLNLFASLKSGSSTLFEDTANSNPPLNTCSVSNLQLTTSALTGTTVGGALSTDTFEKCTQGPITIDNFGTFTIERIAGTTNGTVKSIGTKATWSTSTFGVLTCQTSSSTGTDIGKITGVASGTATLDINAIINCGVIITSLKWEGTYTITTPTGLGVTS